MSKESLINHLSVSGQDTSWESLAEAHNIKSGEHARQIWKSYRRKNFGLTKGVIPGTNPIRETAISSAITPNSSTLNYSEDLKEGKAEVTTLVDQEIKTLDELINKTNIDTTKWDIVKWQQNFWNNRYQVKAYLEPKVKPPALSIAEILKDYQSNFKPIDVDDIIQNETLGDSLFVLSLADFHLDKEEYIKETDVEKHLENYYNCLTRIASRAIIGHNIKKVIFIIGNDFFHTDNIHNTTTNHTPQDVSMPWDKAYELGFDLMARSITYLKYICKELEVVLVPGNHPVTKEFYMAHALKLYFSPDKNIQFDIRPIGRKAFVWGNNFFGLAHGNCKTDKLPVTFSTEFYELWGQARFKEILIGDKHTDRQTSYVAKNEFSGVQVRVMPSLSTVDKWHYDNQFQGNIQRGVGLIYSKDRGKVAELYENVDG